MFWFVEPSLISQPGIAGASIDERAVSLANRFQSAPKEYFSLFLTIKSWVLKGENWIFIGFNEGQFWNSPLYIYIYIKRETRANNKLSIVQLLLAIWIPYARVPPHPNIIFFSFFSFLLFLFPSTSRATAHHCMPPHLHHLSIFASPWGSRATDERSPEASTETCSHGAEISRQKAWFRHCFLFFLTPSDVLSIK